MSEKDIKNSDAIKKNAVKNIMDLSEKINKFAYENGMNKELAEKIVKEIS